ncbi:MAG: hypothetical protein HON04_10490 [Planctomicrobium sp.]|nr:hypothetical protein [Planctomicrobium sp.]
MSPIFITAMCSPHPNLLPTATLLARMNIDCGEKGHVESLIGERFDLSRSSANDKTRFASLTQIQHLFVPHDTGG